MSWHTIRFVETAHLNVAYHDSGPVDAPIVVLLHGWPDDARSWERVAALLNDAGFRTIAPYLRGFGPTRFLDDETPRSGQISALGADLLELLDALRLAQVTLVGHDWGARAAYIAASEAPARVAHLVALSVGYGTNSPAQELALEQARNYWYHWFFCLPRGEHAVRTQGRQLTELLWRTWSPGWNFAPDEFERTAASFENPDWASVTLHSYRHRWGHAPGDPGYDNLERRLAHPAPVAVPTLVLHGGADACNAPFTSEGKEGHFRSRYERVVLDRIGHFPQRESPDLVARHIVRWIGS